MTITLRIILIIGALLTTAYVAKKFEKETLKLTTHYFGYYFQYFY